MNVYRLHYAPDNASLIVRLALEELGAPYQTALVDRAARAQCGAAYLALNPAGRIPTLETPDGPVSETAAILLWLADRHGQLAPGPADPARAAVLNWLFYMSNTLHADMIGLFYAERQGPASAREEIRAASRARIAAALRMLHDAARPRLGPWLCGDTPSILDLYLAPMLRWLQLYPSDQSPWFDLGAYPAFAAMSARLERRPSVAALCTAEGMTPYPFTAPAPPNPPEGSAV